MPPPISAGEILTAWAVDPVPLVLAAAAGAGYAVGVRRLATRGRAWPLARSVSFGSGLAVLLFATQSGLARYDTELFSVHVVQHLLIGMVAAVLLALGAPVTLAIQAAHRPTQSNLVRFLDHPVVRRLTHPITAWLLFGVTMFVLYFSPLYDLSLRNGVVHGLVHLHFLAVGCLFAWAVIGLDPGWHSGALTYPARVLLVLLMVPFHAVLGLALLGASEVPAADLTDQHNGAAILWGIGDLMGLLLVGIVLYQWMQADKREARRLDRQADDLAR